MIMDELFKKFLTERVYLKNITPATQLNQEKAWRRFRPLLPTDSTALTKDALVQAVASLVSKPGPRGRLLSVGCVNAFIRPFNAFLRWLHTEGHISTTLKLPLRKGEVTVIKAFTPEHVTRLLDYQPQGMNDTRISALVWLILDTGLRIQEALNLRRGDVDFENLLVTVMGKGRKQRIVPMSIEGRKHLFKYCQSHKHDYIFACRYGTRVTYRNAARDFRALCLRLRITGVRPSFHTLRHTFAYSYIKKGGTILYLQKLLGHTTLDMTRRYCDLSVEDLGEVCNKFSLLSR
jgi:integrase/recombinase XerD